jgi:hypothetical protein
MHTCVCIVVPTLCTGSMLSGRKLCNLMTQAPSSRFHALLHAGLAVLLNVAAGVVIGAFRILPKGAFKLLNGFVFKVALPALVCRGIGIKTDLYEDKIWRFIGAFLILRFIALLISVATALLQCWYAPDCSFKHAVYMHARM